MESGSNMFRPFEIEIVKDFTKNSDLLVDINKIKYDEYQQRGLVVQTGKVGIYF
jgi:hypothetical protein